MLEFKWVNSLCVSGDKSGGMAIWDINTGTALMTKTIHKGAVSKINMFSDGTNNLILSGGLRDGVLNILDMRTL